MRDGQRSEHNYGVNLIQRNHGEWYPVNSKAAPNSADEFLARAYDVMMITDRTVLVVGVLALVLLVGRTTNAQRARGELRIEVRDAQGAVVATEADMVSGANQFRRT